MIYVPYLQNELVRFFVPNNYRDKNYLSRLPAAQFRMLTSRYLAHCFNNVVSLTHSLPTQYSQCNVMDMRNVSISKEQFIFSFIQLVRSLLSKLKKSFAFGLRRGTKLKENLDNSTCQVHISLRFGRAKIHVQVCCVIFLKVLCMKSMYYDDALKLLKNGSAPGDEGIQ